MLRSIKKAENNFQALAENARDGILIISEAGTPLYSNRRADELCGMSESELMEVCFWQLLGPDGLRVVRDNSEAGRSEQEAAGPIEALLKTRGGRTIPVELTLYGTDWHGAAARVVIVRDITERKRAEEQARQQQQQLMKTDKLTSLGVLIAAIAHEINNPNQTILLNSAFLNRACPQLLSLLRDHAGDLEGFLIAGLEHEEFLETLPSLLSRTEECSKRIDGIVKNLKAYVREGPKSMTYLDINEVIRSAIELAKSFIQKATESFRLELEDNLPQVRGNAQRIEQVLINLILNACQSLPNRERGFSIGSSYDRKHGAVLIRVNDEGVGISEEDLAKIRTPLFTTKLAQGGTGLGLYVAQTIVEEHHGELHFDSKPGRGTRAAVILPVEEGNEQ
jgi:PAS domain S-box-containing protein